MSTTLPLLGVNIDHAATLRQARYREAAGTCGGVVEPDPVALALQAERAGADGITVHLREDRRHIQERDVQRLRESIRTRLNLEMACTPAMLDFALALRPDTVCLVPESREEVTTEGGLDVAGGQERVAPITKALADAGIGVSLFIDPDTAQIEAAADLQCPIIELHTGAYANAWHQPDAKHAAWQALREAAALAHNLGLVVNAGHGINYHNIVEVRTLPWLHELNIGHSILSRALFTGIDEAVSTMRAFMHGGRV
jgi:pyridoxine 5-phosphate synthase